ncbi:glycosyltransferase family 4 protein [uncultured Bacteroides sp.]|uniref:glycosyltransferase family 4 protein n=1 Tax=uncultured Bacteroides sp. TaxID=162156 RepID=UPI002AAA8426|nr:glycosyltransferase family 4 protein [uncultured Bacteroides sp.]
MSEVKKILVVGQTPPPYGGQALMIKYMLEANYKKLILYHVRMNFSREFNDRGKFSLYKVAHLFTVIYNIWLYRFKYNAKILYYPPSSVPKVAVLRDVIILFFTRFLFEKVIYHFHAAGISENMLTYNRFLRYIIYSVLDKPDLAITSSMYNPKDAEYLLAKKTLIIPLGIPDENKCQARLSYAETSYLTIFFMGLLNSEKGEGYILDAIYKLSKKNFDIRFNIAGKFESLEYKDKFFKKVDEYNLSEKVFYKGVVSGREKQNLFLSSDVFCYPSFFSSESFGLVLLEGMMYQMPLVTTKWRGIQSVVEEENNGFFVEIKNSDQIADVLEKLYVDRNILKEMGDYSRKLFEKKYTLDMYLSKIEEAFIDI